MARKKLQNETNVDETLTSLGRFDQAVQEEADDHIEQRFGLPGISTEEALAAEEEARITRDDGAYDIFDDVEENQFQKGVEVEYFIYRGNTLVGTKEHPYSWKQLAQEFGGGRYRVQAKSLISKKYLTQQTQSVEKFMSQNPQAMNAPAQREPAPERDMIGEFAKLLTLVREASPQTPPPQDNNIMMLMMKMQEMNQQTMLQMSQNMTGMIEKLSDSTSKAVEKMNERVERILSEGGSNKRDKGLDPIELMKLIKDAENSGFERWQALDELAERKAERESHSGGKESKGLVQSLAEGLIPVVAQAAASQMAAQKAQAITVPQAAPVVRAPAQRLPAPKAPPTVRPQSPTQAQSPRTVNPVRPANPVNPVKPKENLQAKIVNTLMPILMKETTSVENAALNSENALKASGIDLPDALRALSRDDMMNIARNNKLPEEFHELLHQFYTALEARAGKDTPNGVHENTAQSEIGGAAALN